MIRRRGWPFRQGRYGARHGCGTHRPNQGGAVEQGEVARSSPSQSAARPLERDITTCGYRSDGRRSRSARTRSWPLSWGEIGSGAVVTASGDQTAIGGGFESDGFGSLLVDGVLRLPAGTLHILNSTQGAEVVVGASGEVVGTVVDPTIGATIYGTGQIDNGGVIALSTDRVLSGDVTVSGHQYSSGSTPAAASRPRHPSPCSRRRSPPGIARCPPTRPATPTRSTAGPPNPTAAATLHRGQRPARIESRRRGR